jgi:hypothetical protein
MDAHTREISIERLLEPRTLCGGQWCTRAAEEIGRRDAGRDRGAVESRAALPAALGA